MQLEGQVALVTGCGGALGRAIALALAREGADVVVNDVSEESAQATADAVKGLGRRAMVNTADITAEDETQALVGAALKEFGRIDVLVNNAGIRRDGLLVRMSEEDWDAVIEVNLKGAFLCTKAVARPMMKQRSGAIVNVSSVAGVIGNVGQANYASSKAGLIGLAKTAARELAGRGVRVNAVAPGFIEAGMTVGLSDEVREQFLQQVPLGRAGTAEDVAEVVVFLASPASSYVTGQVINVDGGMIM